MSTTFDTSGFVESLKQLTIGSLHKDIDRIHENFVLQQSSEPSAITRALGELNNVCGEGIVRKALETNGPLHNQLVHPLPTGIVSPPDSGETNGPPDISQAALDAWNHALSCPVFLKERTWVEESSYSYRNTNQRKSPESCKFPMCDRVRPSVLHRVSIKKKGIVGKCLEGCKDCGFFVKMKDATAESHADPKFHKFQRKRLRLNQKFAGLLLAHTSGQGDEEMLSLYKHVMECDHPVQTPQPDSPVGLRSACTFRNSHGSCQTAMQLLAHYQMCRLIKQCTVCSALPPKLRRLKKTRSAIPVPKAIKRFAKRPSKRKRKVPVESQPTSEAPSIVPAQSNSHMMDLSEFRMDVARNYSGRFNEPEPIDFIEKNPKRRHIHEDESFDHFFMPDTMLDAKPFPRNILDGFLSEV